MSFVSITAIKAKRIQHMGMYNDPKIVERITKYIEDFAGKGWRIHDVQTIKQLGVFHDMSPKPRKSERTNQRDQKSIRNRAEKHSTKFNSMSML